MGTGKPYRRFVIDGFEILVGKASRENDELTFDVAKPHDLWLHAGGGTAGSHVVVRNPGQGEVPREIVDAAAALAAWYSKARGAPFVKVDWCRRADVSKPRGAPAGTVELRRFKTLKVKPAVPATVGDEQQVSSSPKAPGSEE